MKLVIDTGNTATKVGVFEGKTLLETRVYRPLERVDIRDVRNTYKIEEALLCTVSNTPDWITEELADIRFVLWNTYLENLQYPIFWEAGKLELGRDRIAVAVALHELYPKMSVLGIALGSCITYNLVTAQGQLFPGAISPGLSMRCRAMHAFTYALPNVEIRTYEDLLKSPIEVKDTISSILAGAVGGVRYEIEGFINQYQIQYGEIPVVLTGGDHPYFDFSTKKGIFARPNLVLVGLNEILDKNK